MEKSYDGPAIIRQSSNGDNTAELIAVNVQNPDVAAEKPSEAIFDALQTIEVAIGAQGFALAPSGRKFFRRVGDFTFEINIQSDRSNVAGQRAAICVHTAVYSKSLTAWRKKHSSDWIRPKATLPIPAYVNQLGYLCDPSAWVEWDFANKVTRHLIADDLIASIRKGALPLFKVFESSPEEIAAIFDQDWPSPEGILSYLLSTGRVALAKETLQNYLDKRHKFRSDFGKSYHQFLEQGLPPYRAAMSHDLAAFAVATGLTWNSS